MLNKRPTGNIQRDISDLFQEVSALSNSVNQNQKIGSARNEGKEGDIRFVRREDGKSYLMCKGRNDWETTFQGCFQVAGNNVPILHLENLSVDNFYAKQFTINQTNAYNGNWFMSSGTAIVESSTATTITFKDQTNLNASPFAANDKCEIRHISADKSLTIKLSQFTISSVSGRTATVVYESGHPVAKAGDIVVQRGNSVTAARQNAIYFSINDANSPYMAAYTGLTGFTLPTPSSVFGNLASFTSPVHGALSGTGVYIKDNLYIDKGNIYLGSGGFMASGKSSYADTTAGFWVGDDSGTVKFNLGDGTNSLTWNGSALTISGVAAGNKIYRSALSSPPATPATNDIWYQIDTGIFKQWDGDSWENATDTTLTTLTAGVSLSAGGITLGTTSVIKSGQTAYNTGTGWWLGIASGTPKLSMGNGSTKTFTYDGTDFALVGGTITGGTIQTATSGTRLVINESGYANSLRFYDSGGSLAGGISASTSGGLPILDFTAYDVRFAAAYLRNTGDIISNQTISALTGFNAGSGKFIVNSSGQITTVNNLVASSYTYRVLASDGTSYTPVVLTASHIADDVVYAGGANSSPYISVGSANNATLIKASNGSTYEFNGTSWVVYP